MSWLFSQALVAAYSAGKFSDGEPSAQLNVMPTAHPFWRRGKTMDASDLSRSGLTSAVLTDDRGEALLTSFLADFLVRTSVLPEKAQASAASGPVYGRSLLGSLATFDPDTCGWKTAQPCLLGGSTSSLPTWPRSGSMRSGACWEQMPSASLTNGRGCGSSLPTPSGVNGGRNHTMGRVDEWGGSSNPLRGTVIGSMCSPEFEELVMGWPIGWTEPTPFEMARFREWLQEHSESCMPGLAADAA
ncbi:hypothetical protein N7349_16510 [Stenotrophomonas sp. GD04089]|nr:MULTISPECIES: hypothetical protein [Stenotrophomonas]MDH0276149.1 hypothetical protein [Stenotrophomonas sp. GD04089]MDH1910990.1 hypothetical protein [Stenotrophomonas sp. GD03794]